MIRLLIIIILANFHLFAIEFSGRVVSEITPENKFVNIGPVFINDSIFFRFHLINDGTQDLYLREFFPTYIMGLSELDPGENQFELFSTKSPELPITIRNNSNNPDTLTIRFTSRDLFRSKLGWHNANFQLGLSKFDNVLETVTLDTFKLKAKKTNLFIDGFDDLINFDSIMIFPPNEISYNWRLKNVTYSTIIIDKQIESLLTQPANSPEFTISKYPDFYQIIKKNILNYNINYYPTNKGRDSLLLKVQYHPDPTLYPDSVNFAKVMIIATGVAQEIGIISTNVDHFKDTIDLGSVRLGKEISVELNLKNYGNIPFNAKSYKFIKDLSNEIDDRFVLLEQLNKNKKHLKPDSIERIIFSFKADKLGAFFAELIIESDIEDRKIRGFNNSQKFLKFYIRGKVTSPLLSIGSDTVDFGNVNVSSPVCESSQDTVLRLRNLGNEILRISNITISPQYPLSRFLLEENSLEIAPNSDGFIKINFNPPVTDFKTYTADLILTTNQPINPEIRLKLIATSIAPVNANLLIPNDLKAFPGNSIFVPVILQNGASNLNYFANSFKSQLNYNQSLLEFIGIRTVGTATDGAINMGDQTEKPGKNYIDINLTLPVKTYFNTQNDTLFFIKFNTYLGNDESSQISLINPKFADEKCEDVLQLNITTGLFSTDSVCGIDKKIGISAQNLIINNFYFSNTNQQFFIDFTTLKNGELTIKIFDYLGKFIKNSTTQNLNIDNYAKEINLTGLNKGIYFIEVKFEDFCEYFPVIINF